MPTIRTPNFLERILLIIGVLVILVGYGVIRRVSDITGTFGWEAVAVIFLWLILITVIILLAGSENMKEELKIVLENQVEEIKLRSEEVRKKEKCRAE